MPSSAQHQRQHTRKHAGPHASVVLMCGLPGSGKSSFAASMIRNINNGSETTGNNGRETLHVETGEHAVVDYYDPIVLIDYDEIAESIIASSQETPTACAVEAFQNTETPPDTNFSDQDLQAWRDCRNIALSRLEEELRQYFSSYDQKTDNDNDTGTNLLIILDDNFHLRSMRRDIYKICQQIVSDHGQVDENISSGRTGQPCCIGFSVLMVDTPLDTCLKRNALREGKARIPEATVQKMASTLERPEPNSGDYMKKFETNSIVIDNTSDWMGEGGSADDGEDFKWHTAYGDAVRACLDAAMKNPVFPPQREEEVDPEILRKAREETKKNRIHQADRLLRSLVGVVGRTDKSMGRVANDARKHVLQQLRDETVPLAVHVGGDSADDSAYQAEVANAFKSYLEKNETCSSPGSSSVLMAIDEVLQN